MGRDQFDLELWERVGKELHRVHQTENLIPADEWGTNDVVPTALIPFLIPSRLTLIWKRLLSMSLVIRSPPKRVVRVMTLPAVKCTARWRVTGQGV